MTFCYIFFFFLSWKKDNRQWVRTIRFVGESILGEKFGIFVPFCWRHYSGFFRVAGYIGVGSEDFRYCCGSEGLLICYMVSFAHKGTQQNSRSWKTTSQAESTTGQVVCGKEGWKRGKKNCWEGRAIIWCRPLTPHFQTATGSVRNTTHIYVNIWPLPRFVLVNM
jgi:hypothetical protein